jgi:WD40 repeat protein
VLVSTMNLDLCHELKHTSAVSSLATSQNLFVTGSHDNSVRLWDADSGLLKKCCNGHGAPKEVCAVAMSDGPHFASGGRDYTIVIWDLKGELVVQLKWKHRSYVTSLAYAAGQKFLVSGGADGLMMIWNANPYFVRKTFQRCHGRSITSLAISKDSKFIVSGGEDQVVNVWTPEGPLASYGTRCAGKLYRAFAEYRGEVTGVAITSDNRHVVSSSLDGKVRVHCVHSKRCLRSLSAYCGVQSLALSHDSVWIAAGTTAGMLHVWRLEDGTELTRIKAHTDRVTALAFSGDKLVSASKDGLAKVWQINIPDRSPVSPTEEAVLPNGDGSGPPTLIAPQAPQETPLRALPPTHFVGRRKRNARTADDAPAPTPALQLPKKGRRN